MSTGKLQEARCQVQRPAVHLHGLQVQCRGLLQALQADGTRPQSQGLEIIDKHNVRFRDNQFGSDRCFDLHECLPTTETGAPSPTPSRREARARRQENNKTPMMRWLSVLRNAAELCVTCATPTIEHMTTLESRETWGRVDHRCAPKRSHNQRRLVRVGAAVSAHEHNEKHRIGQGVEQPSGDGHSRQTQGRKNHQFDAKPCAPWFAWRQQAQHMRAQKKVE